MQEGVDTKAAPKRRGRPPKPKNRGRPPKNVLMVTADEPKKRRGRPPKVKGIEQLACDADEDSQETVDVVINGSVSKIPQHIMSSGNDGDIVDGDTSLQLEISMQNEDNRTHLMQYEGMLERNDGLPAIADENSIPETSMPNEETRIRPLHYEEMIDEVTGGSEPAGPISESSDAIQEVPASPSTRKSSSPLGGDSSAFDSTSSNQKAAAKDTTNGTMSTELALVEEKAADNSVDKENLPIGQIHRALVAADNAQSPDGSSHHYPPSAPSVSVLEPEFLPLMHALENKTSDIPPASSEKSDSKNSSGLRRRGQKKRKTCNSTSVALIQPLRLEWPIYSSTDALTLVQSPSLHDLQIVTRDDQLCNVLVASPLRNLAAIPFDYSFAWQEADIIESLLTSSLIAIGQITEWSLIERLSSGYPQMELCNWSPCKPWAPSRRRVRLQISKQSLLTKLRVEITTTKWTELRSAVVVIFDQWQKRIIERYGIKQLTDAAENHIIRSYCDENFVINVGLWSDGIFILHRHHPELTWDAMVAQVRVFGEESVTCLDDVLANRALPGIGCVWTNKGATLFVLRSTTDASYKAEFARHPFAVLLLKATHSCGGTGYLRRMQFRRSKERNALALTAFTEGHRVSICRLNSGNAERYPASSLDASVPGQRFVAPPEGTYYWYVKSKRYPPQSKQ